MNEKIVSPGVFTRENDLSFLEEGVAAIGAAFVGPFKEGPLAPTLVNSQAEFELYFGNVDDTYYTPISVQNYLREKTPATICRVTGYGGYKEQNPYLLTIQNSGSAIGIVTASVGILFNTFVGNQTISNGYVILSQVSSSLNFVDDTAAALGGVPLGGLYRNGNFILIRIT